MRIGFWGSRQNARNITKNYRDTYIPQSYKKRETECVYLYIIFCKDKIIIIGVYASIGGGLH